MSLYDRLIRAFFAKPHVGTVKHFDGVTLEELEGALRDVICTAGLRFEMEIEEHEWKPVLNALVDLGDGLQCWLRAEEHQDSGCLIEAKVYHPLELSAQADERLTQLMYEVERSVRKTAMS
ncbi:MAG: hypothetical protein ABDH63_07200 [Candidatus Caldarchaeales archaeon]